MIWDNSPSKIETQCSENISKTGSCSCSTGFHELFDADGSPEKPWGLTFGSGKLSEHGYWSVPCPYHARQAEIRDGVPPGSYWPFCD